MSTSGNFSTLGGINMHVGNIMSTSRDVQYIEGYHEFIGGYHEYIGRCSVHRRKNKLMTEFNECFEIEILCFVSH